MCRYLVEMKDITKKFKGQVVLDSVNFSVRRGEIQGLLGENGAGKSVLMKILTGVHKPDAGCILLDGQKVEFSDPRESQKQGITAIYQDINLVEELSVAENIFFGRLPVKGRFHRRVDWHSAYLNSQNVLDKLKFNIDVKQKVKYLNSGQKQMVEIAKALSQKSKLIIMDEPYTGLSETELEHFFNVIKELRASGISIIYISHRIEEVLNLCDSVSILREGKIVEKGAVDSFGKNKIIKLMIGKEIKDNYPKLKTRSGRVVLKVDSISTERGLKNVSFNLRKGEILGVAGLLGSGRTAIARAVFGLDMLLSGKIYLNETLLNIRSPKDAIRSKIGYIVEDRVYKGLQMDFGIPQNISLANLSAINKVGILKFQKEKDIARGFIKKFVIKTSKLEEKVRRLSGGNQQKVLLSRWMYTDSTILILDEPTKGIDKSTKVELYNFMNKFVTDKSSIIFISSDLQELMGMCDRILVLFNGEIRKQLKREEFSEEKIIYYASGGMD